MTEQSLFLEQFDVNCTELTVFATLSCKNCQWLDKRRLKNKFTYGEIIILKTKIILKFIQNIKKFWQAWAQ